MANEAHARAHGLGAEGGGWAGEWMRFNGTVAGPARGISSCNGDNKVRTRAARPTPAHPHRAQRQLPAHHERVQVVPRLHGRVLPGGMGKK